MVLKKEGVGDNYTDWFSSELEEFIYAEYKMREETE